MCYGDPCYGQDGYYQDMLDREDEQQRRDDDDARYREYMENQEET